MPAATGAKPPSPEPSRDDPTDYGPHHAGRFLYTYAVVVRFVDWIVYVTAPFQSPQPPLHVIYHAVPALRYLVYCHFTVRRKGARREGRTGGRRVCLAGCAAGVYLLFTLSVCTATHPHEPPPLTPHTQPPPTHAHSNGVVRASTSRRHMALRYLGGLGCQGLALLTSPRLHGTV